MAAGLLLLVGGVAAVIVVIIRDRNNKEVGRVVLPEEVSAEVTDEGKGPGGPQGKAGNPLDRLDPNLIPAEERFAWQPKELVAVIGEHRGRSWTNGKYGIASLDFSPDGKTIACGSAGNRVQLFDSQTLRERAALPDTPGCAQVAFSPDGKVLVAYSRAKGRLWLWDVNGPEPKKQFELASGGIQCMAYSRDGKTLAAVP